MVCITRGSRGSMLVSSNEVHEHHGISVHIQDAVGAGDAFTAAVAHHCLRGSNLKTINEAANFQGAYVASEAGATPVVGEEILKQVTCLNENLKRRENI